MEMILVIIAICGVVGGILYFLYGVGIGTQTPQVRIDANKVTFPFCKPNFYEIDSEGKTWAKPYLDKNGRVKYCCNPNHNHFYS